MRKILHYSYLHRVKRKDRPEAYQVFLKKQDRRTNYLRKLTRKLRFRNVFAEHMKRKHEAIVQGIKT